jgi:hypothetical protein
MTGTIKGPGVVSVTFLLSLFAISIKTQKRIAQYSAHWLDNDASLHNFHILRIKGLSSVNYSTRKTLFLSLNMTVTRFPLSVRVSDAAVQCQRIAVVPHRFDLDNFLQ